jgi:hypothetical protein
MKLIATLGKSVNQFLIPKQDRHDIAGAPQIFQKNFFIIFIRKTSPGSEKKSFYEKFAGRQQYF